MLLAIGAVFAAALVIWFITTLPIPQMWKNLLIVILILLLVFFLLRGRW